MNVKININILSRLVHANLIAQLPYAENILDVGAGDGSFVKAYPYLGCKITFFDKAGSDDDGFKYCVEHYTSSGYSHIEGDCTDMNTIKDETYDMVIFTEVIEHLTEEQVKKTLSEIKRVLKPNGRIALSTPNIVIRKEVGKYLANPFHIKEYTNDEIKELLLSYGFKIVKNVGTLEFKENTLNTTVNKIPEEGYLLWFEAIKMEKDKK